MSMRMIKDKEILVAADSSGFLLKEAIVEHLNKRKCQRHTTMPRNSGQKGGNATGILLCPETMGKKGGKYFEKNQSKTYHSREFPGFRQLHGSFEPTGIQSGGFLSGQASYACVRADADGVLAALGTQAGEDDRELCGVP